jgi:hypothetical protein
MALLPGSTYTCLALGPGLENCAFELADISSSVPFLLCCALVDGKACIRLFINKTRDGAELSH